MTKQSHQKMAVRAKKEKARVIAGEAQDAREAEQAARSSPRVRKMVPAEEQVANKLLLDSTNEDKLEDESEDEEKIEAQVLTLIASKKLSSAKKAIERRNAERKQREEEEMAVCYDDDAAFDSDVDVDVVNKSNTGDEASEPSEPDSERTADAGLREKELSDAIKNMTKKHKVMEEKNKKLQEICDEKERIATYQTNKVANAYKAAESAKKLGDQAAEEKESLKKELAKRQEKHAADAKAASDERDMLKAQLAIQKKEISVQEERLKVSYANATNSKPAELSANSTVTMADKLLNPANGTEIWFNEVEDVTVERVDVFQRANEAWVQNHKNATRDMRKYFSLPVQHAMNDCVNVLGVDVYGWRNNIWADADLSTNLFDYLKLMLPVKTASEIRENQAFVNFSAACVRQPFWKLPDGAITLRQMTAMTTAMREALSKEGFTEAEVSEMLQGPSSFASKCCDDVARLLKREKTSNAHVASLADKVDEAVRISKKPYTIQKIIVDFLKTYAEHRTYVDLATASNQKATRGGLSVNAIKATESENKDCDIDLTTEDSTRAEVHAMAGRSMFGAAKPRRAYDRGTSPARGDGNSTWVSREPNRGDSRDRESNDGKSWDERRQLFQRTGDRRDSNSRRSDFRERRDDRPPDRNTSLDKYGPGPTKPPASRSPSPGLPAQRDNPKKRKFPQCDACGMTNHGINECEFRLGGHPGVNTEGPWAGSYSQQCHEKAGERCLQREKMAKFLAGQWCMAVITEGPKRGYRL